MQTQRIYGNHHRPSFRIVIDALDASLTNLLPPSAVVGPLPMALVLIPSHLSPLSLAFVPYPYPLFVTCPYLFLVPYRHLFLIPCPCL